LTSERIVRPPSKKKLCSTRWEDAAQVKAFRANSFGEIAKQIAMRTHLCGRPIRQPAVIHREAIVVFKHGNHVFRAGFLE